MDDIDITPRRVSDQELYRRWRAVREGMEERNLDFLIFQNNTNIYPGYYKWFTDVSIMGNGSPVTVIFPREDDMIIISHGHRSPAGGNPPAPNMRGVKKQINHPAFPSLNYSITWDAEQVVEELASFQQCRIGWVGMGYISAAFHTYITGHMPSATFKDATELVEGLKVQKSDEEISLIRETCALEDKLFEYMLTIVEPGKTVRDIRLDIIHQCGLLGADGANIIAMSAPEGQCPRPGPANRVLQEGDQFIALLETSSPSGFWGELSRTVCIGKIPAALQEHFEAAREAQQRTVNLLKPGASTGDIWNANNEFLRSKGYPEERRLFAHGQGYDMVERPCLTIEEPMEIKPRMFFAIHPETVSDRARGWICDNFLVLESGEVEWMHKTPQKIYVV